ncbi:hypothetical protein [Caldovatus aquaticus]|uniref:Uncharacterized protein n=1 Tax=Caldovatus aquaticus TaxID=2865671 RepID=A0ABS7F4F9_9PROT|nr:hypothetical protein [Caldovatus aquaticus]MBW8270379.1 hypothetical protein [Caldovatus aquaticus]
MFAFLAGGGAAPSAAEFLARPHPAPLWFEPALTPAAAPGPAPLALAMFTAPRGWASGDAVAILFGDAATRPGGVRDGLAATLLAEDTGVLEVGAVPDGAADEAHALQLARLFGALRALRRDQGAGPVVVAIGYGAGEDAVLAAAVEAVAALHLGADGPRFAAAIAIGPVAARFTAGTPPPPAERWRERVPLLCAALAPVTGDPGGIACTAALLGGEVMAAR